MGGPGGHGDNRGRDHPRKSSKANSFERRRYSNCPGSHANPKSAIKSMKKVLSRMWKKWKFSYCCSYHLPYKGRQYTFTRVFPSPVGGRARKLPTSSQESCSRERCRDKLFGKQRKAFFATFFLLQYLFSCYLECFTSCQM